MAQGQEEDDGELREGHLRYNCSAAYPEEVQSNIKKSCSRSKKETGTKSKIDGRSLVPIDHDDPKGRNEGSYRRQQGQRRPHEECSKGTMAVVYEEIGESEQTSKGQDEVGRKKREESREGETGDGDTGISCSSSEGVHRRCLRRKYYFGSTIAISRVVEIEPLLRV